MTDSARSAVYRAEQQWSALMDRGGEVDFLGSVLNLDPQLRFGDLSAIERFCAFTLNLPNIVAVFGRVPTVRVRARKGAAAAHYEPATQVIAIPMQSTWAARQTVVIHELAHHIRWFSAGEESAILHDESFTSVMCTLVQESLSPAAALVLRASYDGAGVRVGA